MHRYLLPKILCQITFQKFLHVVNGTVVVDDIIWDYKYMILHILRSYGIIKPTEKWNVPNNERILKAVQYLSLINLIKPAKVYVLAHHWHNLTAVSKVPWKEQSSVGTLSQYSSNNNNYYYHYISLLPKSLFYSNREKEHPLLQDSFVEFHTVAKYDLHFYMFSTKAGLSIAFFGNFYEEWLLWFEFVVLVSHQGVAPGIPRKLLSGTFLVCALHVLCTGFSLCDNKQDLPCFQLDGLLVLARNHRFLFWLPWKQHLTLLSFWRQVNIVLPPPKFPSSSWCHFKYFLGLMIPL